MKVLVLHGTAGNSRENWFPWLREELEKRGIECKVPDLPAPDKPRLKEWLNELGKYHRFLDRGTVLVAHSLGCILALRKIEQGAKVKGAILVAPFIGKLGKEVDEANKDFLDESFDWKCIGENCSGMVVFCSDNDPFVPAAKSKEVAEKLGAKIIQIKGAGHFNERTGYVAFPQLLDALLKKFK